MRLCVIALNPAIDAEWRVEDVLWEEKNIVQGQRRWPGGKGVNVARWLKLLRAESELLIPLGGDTGREMLAGVRAQKLRTHVVQLAEQTRVNVVVTTASGRQMRFNPRGPKLSTAEWRKLLRLAEQRLAHGASLILSGALPRGVSADAYAQLIRLAHRHERLTFLDCDGEALAAGVKAKPFLVKPNLHELSLWAGKTLRGDTTVRSAALALSRNTGSWVLTSLGERGALLVNSRQNFAVAAFPPRVRVLNTVGAGDALLAAAANAVANGDDPEEWVCIGVAAGTAATRYRAGKLPSREAVRRISGQVRLQRL